MIYLIRHGQTNWNVEGKLQGKTDIPLNENGKKQAKNISDNIAKLNITRIISSDLSRAKETAEIINEKIQGKMFTDKRLREVDYGELEGKFVKSFSEETWDIFNSSPEKLKGESRENVYRRIKSLFNEIKDEEENILVVTHGGALRMMMYYANNKDSFNKEEYEKNYKNMKINNTEIFELGKLKNTEKDIEITL